ncbi:MAG TPA: bifunctional transaldolase/phosoglucose isomerase [Pyrinomonadaceae bacterium]
MSLNQISYTLPSELQDHVSEAIEAWTGDDMTNRVWQKDASVWTGGDESKWLGWLDIVAEESEHTVKYRRLSADIEGGGFTHVLLMGMGGSSLCPEVLATTFGKKTFHILDSTVPSQVKAIEEKLDLPNTLFIVASKSGSTLEPNCFKQYFFDRVTKISDSPGKQFVAITDPGSKLEQIAKDDGFRHIFYGKPEIGGRFSALSAFGLAAASAIGLDVEILLKRAEEMVEACRSSDARANPGALLGIILGVSHRFGRDKLTIFTSPEVYDLGAWLEQLIAESTGKEGVAIIPVDREPVLSRVQRPASGRPVPTEGGTPERYSSDRVFVHIGVKSTVTVDDQYRLMEDLEREGHPVIRIELESLYHISQEFFRWEFATAVAGSVMKINPFDQPDVESAKVEARKITDEYERSGSLPDEAPFFEDGSTSLYSNDSNIASLNEVVGGRPSLSNYLDAHVSRINENDYFALLAYLEMNSENEKLLQSIRKQVLRRTGVATCLGFGPRFLHSTGQAYKGGPNTGVFLQITSDDEADLPVPGQKYTFGVVKAAQARGDFQVLLDRERRAVRVHLKGSTREGLERILAALITNQGTHQ